MNWYVYQNKHKQYQLRDYNILWRPNTKQDACDRVNTPHVCGGTVEIHVKKEEQQRSWYYQYETLHKLDFSCENTIEGIKLFIKLTQERGELGRYLESHNATSI